jgi:3-oxoacyl-[acyl-carrier-protein] synthase II
MDNRIFITGIGTVTSIGLNIQEFWKNCLAGVSGISPITSFDTSSYPYPNKNGGEIKNFQYELCDRDSEAKLWGRCTKFACSAVGECLESGGLTTRNSRSNVGVIWGTTMGEAKELEIMDNTWRSGFTLDVDSLHSDNFLYQRIPQNVAKFWGLTGYHLIIPNACASGNFALAYGYELIKCGFLDKVIVGGSDTFNRYTFSGFCRIGAVTPDVPRPFSQDSKGMIPAEGAGALLLESEESVVGRKIKPIAQVLSYGSSNDAHHITQPDPQGIALAYRRALEMGGIAPREVSYISVHGTGTKTNDPIECRALRSVFGEFIGKIPLSSIKSTIGHTMGAASAIEAVVSVLAIRDNLIPPTTNFSILHPDCNDIDPVPNVARSHEVNVAFNAASGFGGNNCVTIFKKCN